MRALNDGLSTRSGSAGLAWNVLLELGEDGGGPLLRRLRRALVAGIRNGRLPGGCALPPSRQLAAELGCSRWVVTEAYAQLIAEGYLEGRTGSATRVVGSDRPAAEPAPLGPAAPPPRFDLAPGLPDLRAFPRDAWAAAIRAEVQRLAVSDLGYPAPGGHIRLRRALAGHLHRVRGATAGAGDVTVSAGITDGLGRICRSLARAGVTALAVEDPTWPRLRRVVAESGLVAVPLPVDEQGLRAAELAAHPEVGAALVAPAHQYPTGVVLSPARRAALLDWARRMDGVVIEDDYDAEFRYDGRSPASLQGTDSTRVILLGSASKTLAPAIGIGWIVAPPPWTRAVRAERVAGPSTLDQVALAAFMESGTLDRHLRAARLRYRARRDELVAGLRAVLPGCSVSGIAAGLHLVLSLPQGTDEAAVVEAAAARGVRVWSLDRHRVLRGAAAAGLVLGYGNLAAREAGEAARELAAAIAEAR